MLDQFYKRAAVLLLFLPLLAVMVASMTGCSSPLHESAEYIGFSTGGAKDIDNFRKNIENGFLPLPTDITYEGIYYDYFFDTGPKEESHKLFYPSYSYALSRDPLSGIEEYYLQVGLNSSVKETDFRRKKLNLVIVLDISGSMGSCFDRYYYDQFGNKELKDQANDEDAGKSKMEIANKAVVGLLDHLTDDDYFGMVLFDNEAYTATPLRIVGNMNIDAVKHDILGIKERGGTNMEAGMKQGTALFNELLNADPEEYESRIIFLTDAMPNIGMTAEDGLLGMITSNAVNKIYTTFIGIGVDFNTELAEAITKSRGCNYYSVHSASEFKTRMSDEFEYMVTPLVFNLSLKLESEGFAIEKIYGSPDASEATGEIMKVNTLFPSKSQEGQTKGGIVILKLKKTGNDDSLRLTASYEDRSGKIDSHETTIYLPPVTADHYDNTGIRKGILLARYVNLMKNWTTDVRESYEMGKPVVPAISCESGIIIPPVAEPGLGIWERQSIPLQIPDEYKSLIAAFKEHFKSEAQAIGDEDLLQEVSIMDKLVTY